MGFAFEENAVKLIFPENPTSRQIIMRTESETRNDK
jgi:hypothetical protein